MTIRWIFHGGTRFDFKSIERRKAHLKPLYRPEVAVSLCQDRTHIYPVDYCFSLKIIPSFHVDESFQKSCNQAHPDIIISTTWDLNSSSTEHGQRT